MSEAARSGPFWDMIEGRAPMPPVTRLLGWTLLSIDPERGEIRVRFEAKPDFLNPAGTVQGGILSAMLDDTMGPAAVALLGGNRFTQTLELKTSFYRPARPGPIIGFGRVAHRGRELIFLEGTLSDGEGKYSRRRRRPPASSSSRPSNKLLPAANAGRWQLMSSTPTTCQKPHRRTGILRPVYSARDFGRDCYFSEGWPRARNGGLSAVRSASPNRTCS